MRQKTAPVWLAGTMILVILVTLIPAVPIHAEGRVSFWLGPYSEAVIIGDTMYVEVNSIATDTIVGAFEMTMGFDASRFQYLRTESIAPQIGAGELDAVGGAGKVHFLYLDADGGQTGITTGLIFRVYFRVIGGKPEDEVIFAMRDSIATDADGEWIGSITNSAWFRITYPSMGNNELASLTVNHGQLQPAFSNSFSGAYILQVPYSVDRIEVDARLVNERCILTIINPPLVPGAKTVIEINVQYPLGFSREYAIFAYRDRAPGQTGGAGGTGNIGGDGGAGEAGEAGGAGGAGVAGWAGTGGDPALGSPDATAGGPATSSPFGNVPGEGDISGSTPSEGKSTGSLSSDSLSAQEAQSGMDKSSGSVGRANANAAAGSSDAERSRAAAAGQTGGIVLIVALALTAMGGVVLMVRRRRRGKIP